MKQLEDKITSITQQINELDQIPRNLATFHHLTGVLDGLYMAKEIIESQTVKQLEHK